MLDDLKRSIPKINLKTNITNTKKPKHIAISFHSDPYLPHTTSQNKEEFYRKVYSKRISIINDIINLQVELSIPTLSIFIFSTDSMKSPLFSIMIDNIIEIFNSIHLEFCKNNKIRVSVIGKWYDLPSRLVDSVKKIIDETRNYDSYLLNFFVNYDGKEEVVDAFRLIGRQIKAERIDPEAIDTKLIEDNLYSSSFIDPDLIIETGNISSDLLLWKRKGAVIFFSGKDWINYTKKDIIDAINYFMKSVS